MRAQEIADGGTFDETASLGTPVSAQEGGGYPHQDCNRGHHSRETGDRTVGVRTVCLDRSLLMLWRKGRSERSEHQQQECELSPRVHEGSVEGRRGCLVQARRVR